MSAALEPGVIGFLQELIRIPSVNPDGDPGTSQPGETGEGAIAEFLAGYLAELGAEVELRDVLPGRPNLLARFPAAEAGRPRLLLAPHLDTVSVKGMMIDPFGGEVRDGRVWGRGATDTKGSIAAMVWALRQCRDVLPDLEYEVWFAGLMNEEAGLQGSRALAAQEHFDFVIAGEPTGLQVVNATKGTAWATVRTRGQAVHSSIPDQGRNAIYAMAGVIAFLRDEVGAEFADEAAIDAVLGAPTLSVGLVRGGSKVNIVPDSCEAVVDFRTVPGQDLDGIWRRLRAMGAEVDVVSSPPMLTDSGHAIIRTLNGLGAGCTAVPWFCDGAMFAERGMSAVALGPGSIAQAHTEDEWLAVADLEAGAAFFERFLRALRGG